LNRIYQECKDTDGKPIKLAEQVKQYQDYWKSVEEERKKQGEAK